MHEGLREFINGYRDTILQEGVREFFNGYRGTVLHIGVKKLFKGHQIRNLEKGINNVVLRKGLKIPEQGLFWWKGIQKFTQLQPLV